MSSNERLKSSEQDTNRLTGWEEVTAMADKMPFKDTREQPSELGEQRNNHCLETTSALENGESSEKDKPDESLLKIKEKVHQTYREGVNEREGLEEFREALKELDDPNFFEHSGEGVHTVLDIVGVLADIKPAGVLFKSSSQEENAKLNDLLKQLNLSSVEGDTGRIAVSKDIKKAERLEQLFEYTYNETVAIDKANDGFLENYLDKRRNIARNMTSTLGKSENS